MTDADDSRARMVGINHVALEVGDVDDTLDFYGTLFEVELRGRGGSSAFLDMGDQFLALSETDDAGDPDDHRHVASLVTSLRSLRSRRHRHLGLVVDDPRAVDRRLDDTDGERVESGGLDFRDPSGNRVQVVAYEDVQFTKADRVLEGMGLSDLENSESALAELAEKGMAPE
jgi:catechol 2,3-dioxygenase-like lactoylglutathione lyase family enzyme